MKKRYALFAVIFAVSMLIGIQAIEIVDANPIPYPVTPSQEKPILEIETPNSNSSYFITDRVTLNFSVIQPDSWGIDYDSFYRLGQITGIEVSLDGNLTSCPYNSTVRATNSPICVTPPLANYSITLNNLTLGIHQVNVTVLAYSFYTNPIYGSQNIPVPKNSFILYENPIIISKIVNFAVEQQKPSSLVTASATEQMNVSNNLDNSIVPIGVTFVIVIVVVTSVPLVYFKRRRGKK